MLRLFHPWICPSRIPIRRKAQGITTHTEACSPDSREVDNYTLRVKKPIVKAQSDGTHKTSRI
jgi:hypothetical protein